MKNQCHTVICIDFIRVDRIRLGCVLNNVRIADISELYSYGDRGGTAYSRYGYGKRTYGGYGSGYGSSEKDGKEDDAQ